jgi:hypothetical protein
MFQALLGRVIHQLLLPGSFYMFQALPGMVIHQLLLPGSFAMFQVLSGLVINQLLLSLHFSYCCCCQVVLPCFKVFQGWSFISCFLVYTYLAAAKAARYFCHVSSSSSVVLTLLVFFLN